MDVLDSLVRVTHLAALLAVVAVIIGFGRFVARGLRQPEVIGEITVGLLAGPLTVWLLGPDRFALVLPEPLFTALKFISYAALALFLVGMTHKLRADTVRAAPRAIGWTAAGSLVPALGAGLLLALFVVLDDFQPVRGDAPTASLVLMIALSLSITAVPVLARILADRSMTETNPGRIAFSAAVVVDSICWLLLPVAVGLAAGQLTGFLRSLAVLAGAVLVALAVRVVLRSRPMSDWCARRPVFTVGLIGVLAIAMAIALEELGLTVVFGAVLAGLAVPAKSGEHWAAAVGKVSSAGRRLVPIFFVVTGITVFTRDFSAVPAMVIVLALVLGMAGKLLGGYFGARLGGQSTWDSMRVGALMNTRGLTELIVLQVGYSAGILTAPLFLALVVMALVTTGATGPLLGLIDRAELHRCPPQRSDRAGITRTNRTSERKAL
jgi:Kef-type K+ transport system membrane component KefB